MKRNYGIDLLRVAVMLFVAALHIIGIGGIITGAELLSPQFLTVQLLRIAMLCAVDCYAMISGFVGWSGKPKLSSIAMLWVRAVVFCIVITGIFSRFYDLDSRTLLSAVLPVTTGQYWYLTAYAGLFAAMPLLNFILQKMPERELTLTLWGILILFCVLPISPLTDAFFLHDGYSAAWLAVMYLLGGYLSKYGLLSRLSGRSWCLIYAGAVFFAWAPRMIVLWLKPIYWSMSYGNILIEYTSPTIVLAAVALLALFSRMELPSGLQQATAKLSPHTFGIYLFHTHPLMFRYVLEGRFAALGTGSIAGLIGTVLAGSLLICIAGTAADWMVTSLLKLMRIDRLLKKLDGLIH